MPVPEGYFRFVAEFEWDIGMDDDARRRFLPLFDKLPRGIDRETLQAYYLTAERRVIVIGQTKSSAALQEFTSAVIYNSPIDGRVYHVVEGHEMRDIFKQAGTAKKRARKVK